MQPANQSGDPLYVMCPTCGVPVIIDDKTLSRLWGQRMKARRAGRPVNSRFAKMTEDQRKVAATAAANARWTAHRAAVHQSIAAPKPEPPKKHSILESLDALDALIKEGEHDG
jgi:hypothetical protein